MTYQTITVRSLVRETFATIGSVYGPLLAMNFVELLIVLVLDKKLGAAPVPWNIIYLFWAVPFLWGAISFYIYRSLTANQVTVGEAFKQANKRLLQLILANIPNLICALLMYALFMNGLLAFMIEAFNLAARGGLQDIFDNSPAGPISVLLAPGLFLLIFLWYSLVFRLTFSLYGTVIDNSSALHSVSSSWRITKGHFWLMCRAIFLLVFVATLPTILNAILIHLSEKLGGADFVGSSLFVAGQLVSIVLGFAIQPLIAVYLVLLYLRLRDSAATIQ